MGVFKDCLLACDIDGTLAEHGVIPERNLSAIDMFIKEGGEFCLATGRSIDAFRKELSALGCISPCMIFNGGAIYDYKKEEFLFEQHIPYGDYGIIKTVLSLNKNIGVEVHSGKNVFNLYKTKEVLEHQYYEGFSAKDATFDEVKNLSWNKVLLALDSKQDLDFLKEFIASQICTSPFFETSAYLGGRKRLYYELIPKGVDKALGLSKLKEILKTRDGCVFAIGDYYNDLPMIKNADISAVTSDSPDELKQYADFIAGSCSGGAVADFINYLYQRKEANDGFSN